MKMRLFTELYRSMKHLAFIALLLFSLPLAAKKAPKWKQGNFKPAASGLQYKIVKEGKGDSIRLSDDVLAELYRYSSSDQALIKNNGNTHEGKIISLHDKKNIPGIIESIQKLKKGGKGYFIIPPSLGKAGSRDTLYCCIVIKNVFRNEQDVFVADTAADNIPQDNVGIVVTDPEEKYFGDTLFSVMKLTEQPQLVDCGLAKVTIAFKFEMTYFESGLQRKSILVFIECPEIYGKDYFIKGSSYVVTCVPLLDDLKTGRRTMNAYSLEKLDRYYGLRVRKM